jgi:DNA-binding phage protein
VALEIRSSPGRMSGVPRLPKIHHTNRMASSTHFGSSTGTMANMLAHDSGLTREELFAALSPDGNPEFPTVMKVIRALGLHLHRATTTR